MTLFAAVVAASTEVAATSSRSRKIAALAELLRALEPDEVAPAVAFLTGVPRQGRIGIGYSTIRGLDGGRAPEPSLGIDDVDGAVAALQALGGAGAGAKRKHLLTDLLGRATEGEAEFVTRLFTGGLRQGALAGLMVDAVAKAAGVDVGPTRRAWMLSGDLTRTAELALTQG